MTLDEARIHCEVTDFLQRADKDEPDANMVVTARSLEDGSHIPLSCFGSNIWVLPNALFPHYAADHEKRMNFDRVPLIFQRILKIMVLRFYFYGLEGSVRPRGSTVIQFFSNASVFLRFLEQQGFDRLDRVNTLLTSQYVETCRSKINSQSGKHLSATTLSRRFSALEMIHQLSRHSFDVMAHPWPESSAALHSGVLDENRWMGKTLIIPDEVLSNLFSQAYNWIENAEELLEHRNAAHQWQQVGLFSTNLNIKLAQRGYGGGLQSLNKDIARLLDACMLIILITSGIRLSELASLRSGCASTTVDDDGERYHWINGYSDKTHEGETSWLVPAIAHTAINLAERITKPLTEVVQAEIYRLCEHNKHCPELSVLKQHQDILLLGHSHKYDRIKTLSGAGIRSRLNKFAEIHGIDWRFTPHQFRRTFAVYAAHSAYGDLRYLREHFKHWSLDMTALYAVNEHQDAEIYDEILASVRNIKIDVLDHWLNQDTPISGGMAEPIKNFRNHQEVLTTYSGRREMAEKLSGQISIRSTGVAWCTADFSGCNGGQSVDTTRCADCKQSVIDDTRQTIWESIYAQQVELRQIDDIGPSGQERVERDINRCKKVLSDLGADPERLSRHG